jgi:type VI secretion system protein ImpK
MTEYSLVSLDPTIVRPRSQSGSQRRAPRPVASPKPATLPQQAVEQAPGLSSVRANEALEGTFEKFANGGVNPLVQAAAPLLILAGWLREQIAEVDLHRLHEQCAQELHNFQLQAVRAGASPENVDAAGYALCSLLDEAVLSTPWGISSNWAARSLLLNFHNETSGWEEVAHIAGSALSDPPLYRALIEFLYLCLSVGFDNQQRLGADGVARLTNAREDLFACIQTSRDGNGTELSLQWQGVEDDKHRAVRRVAPLRVVAAGCGALLLTVFVCSSTSLSKRSASLNVTLARVGRDASQSPVPTSVSAPAAVSPHAAAPMIEAPPLVLVASLKELLARQISQGVMRVEELSGGRQTIILTVGDLFASGSARINPHYIQLIDEVAGAMEQVPGHYRVTGHTDDLPVHSLRFADNFALSRERAQQVVSLLKMQVHDAGRLDFEGMGSAEPRYVPENLPENRARNRRVEITLLTGV